MEHNYSRERGHVRSVDVRRCISKRTGRPVAYVQIENESTLHRVVVRRKMYPTDVQYIDACEHEQVQTLRSKLPSHVMST